MAARLDDAWHYHGLRAVILENRDLRAVVLPEAGAKLFSLVHKKSDTELLWHHPRIPPRRLQYGAAFDDTFCGGWDELFPTAEACEFRGERVPDHGELWALPWTWQSVPTTDSSACLYTSVLSPIYPVRFERWLNLKADLPYLRASYRVTNLSTRPLDFIWGIHPLLAISPDHRLDLPPCTVLVDHASSSDLGVPGQQYAWPHLPSTRGSRDMRFIPAETSQSFAGHYATETTENWFALTDTKKQIGLALIYPTNVFKTLWLWQSYGGWRGLYHLAIEPWVGYPVNLAQAFTAGRHTTLQALGSVAYEVEVVVYSGVRSVERFTEEGDHYIPSTQT